MHPRNAGYEPGNHWVQCDRCPAERRAKDMRKEWNGLWVCKDRCYEPRHPGDFVRGVKENIAAMNPVRTVPEPISSGVEFEDHEQGVPSGTFTGNNNTL